MLSFFARVLPSVLRHFTVVFEDFDLNRRLSGSEIVVFGGRKETALSPHYVPELSNDARARGMAKLPRSGECTNGHAKTGRPASQQPAAANAGPYRVS